MTLIITGLIILACIVLAFFILVQNPKGGGLSGSFGSMSTQVMGVKQSGDIMEKGTWVLISTIAGLCIISVMFMQKPQSDDSSKIQQQTPSKSAPAKKGK
jgi:preprotein translocase subunit SecG